MKRGDKRTITVGKLKIDAEYLGSGRHCVAYRFGDTVYCFVDEDEAMKEAISMWCDDLPHIPKIEDVGNQFIRGVWKKVYKMPYYRNINAKDKEAWAVLKTLKKTADDIFHSKYCVSDKSLWMWGQYYMDDIIEQTRGKIPESVTEALESMMNAGANYGMGIAFEFGQRNIGVDSEGRIVFRDILFDAEKMHREMAAKRGW